MANPSPPPQSFTIPLFFLLLLLTAAAAAAASSAAGLNTTSPYQELETMLQTLRRDGYALFTNAIATSDLKFQLLTTITNATSIAASGEPASPFTLFAPTDELLFALDMATDADVYVSTLKYHVIPNRRHTFDGLRNLTSPFLETLLPKYSVLIGKTRIGRADLVNNATAVGIMVDGVRVTNPDLFLGSRIAVHGIDGILLTGLNLNHQFGHTENGSDLSAPAGSPPEFPRPGKNIPEAETPKPKPQFNREGIPPAGAPAARSNGKTPIAPPGIWQGKTKKSLSGRKKIGRRRRSGGGGGHGRRSKGHHRHRLEEL
ncbi:fasciclin-like arabinogalactan family protein [Striga asiatica]|uniref:Fasciclin-like arabinogalactan family protein n=1 Tax=Striga asiatica TaxID=4170 RepID=A0A5A7QRD2_STRAF|nr:fasciclin-like arabinogalactan family protein [Striga asiatica]